MTAPRRFLLTLLAVLATLSLPAGGAFAHHGHHGQTKLKGAWTNPVGACVQHIISFDSATGAIKCTGSSNWKGTWKGSTKWTFTGTLNVSTGAGSGRVDEVFTGRAHDGRRGRLTFVEHITIGSDGATSRATSSGAAAVSRARTGALVGSGRPARRMARGAARTRAAGTRALGTSTAARREQT
jgi:hypothetical protein